MDDARADFIAGLQALAQFYADNPDFPLPYQGANSPFSVQAPWENRAARFADLVRTLGGDREKTYTDDYAHVTRDFGGGVRVDVWAPRDEVCTRTKVGTVTELQPDPNAPLVEVEVDVYSWDCTPVTVPEREAVS